MVDIMYEKVFVFGTKIFQEKKRDAISSLPLELSWKIFLYLSDAALRIASRVCKIWERIIMSNRNLRRRLNHFELAIKFGSERRAKFYKRKRKILKKMKNFLPVNKCIAISSETTVLKSKRIGDDIIVCTKRYRLY